MLQKPMKEVAQSHFAEIEKLIKQQVALHLFKHTQLEAEKYKASNLKIENMLNTLQKS